MPYRLEKSSFSKLVVLILLFILAIWVVSSILLKERRDRYSQDVRMACISQSGAVVELPGDIPRCIRPMGNRIIQ